MKEPGEPASTLSPAAAAGSTPLADGTRVGRFVIEGVLGRGGAGVVYAALDPRLGRRVALKLLISTGSLGSRARLLREAQSMARLAHPNVAVVFDAGEHGDRLFVAMELVDGRSLDRWLKEHKLGWREILELYLQAGRGLAAAHAADIIHRDFKPANVLVGSDGRPRVSDFGLARGTELGTTSDESLPEAASDEVTRSGTVLGTPAYMPPEQSRGEPASPRSDQYSFCVALWEGLYGKRPGPFPAAPPRSPVPASIKRALLRGLAHGQEDRWPSMDALLGALSAAGRRRSRLLVALAALLAAGAVAGVVVARRDAPSCAGQERRLRGIWDAERKAAMEKAFLATGLPYAAARFATVAKLLDRDVARWVGRAEATCVADRVRHELAPEDAARRTACLGHHLDALRAWVEVFSTVDVRRVQAAAGLAAARDEVDVCEEPTIHTRPTPTDPVLAQKVSELRAELERLVVRKHIGEIKPVSEGLARLTEAARATGYRPLLSEVLAWYGPTILDMGEVDLSARLLDERMALAEETRDDRARGAAWADKVFVLNAQHRYAEAHEAARYAEAVLRPLIGPEVEGMRVGVLQGNSDAYWYEHDRGMALMLYTAALQRAIALRGANSIRLVPYLIGMGQNLDYLGDYERAEAMFKRALAITEAVSGTENAQVAMLLTSIASLYAHREDDAQALDWRLRAQQAMEGAFGPDHLYPAEHQINVAQSLIRAGRVDEALDRLGRARPVMEAKLPPDSPEMSELRSTFGHAYLAAGKPALAVDPLEAALAAKVARKAHADDLAATRFDLARALWGAGRDRARARKLAEEARAGFSDVRAGERGEVDRWLAQARR